MKRMLIVAFAFSALACTDRLGPEAIAGRYELISINAALLPIDKGPLLTRDARPTGCRYVIDEGYLELVADGSRFLLSYQYEDSCNGRVLSKIEEEGIYSFEDGRLVLRQSFPNAIPEPFDREFRGEVIGDTIRVLLFEDRLRFER